MAGQGTVKAIRLLLNSAIDYAGLFPPASLGMGEALREYAGFRAGAFAWALGRFVVPAARLEELREGIETLDPLRDRGGGWRLCVLGGTDPESDLERVIDFERRSAAAAVDWLEWRLRGEGEIDRILGVFSNRPVYFEVPICEDARVLIAALARRGARAKVRTGGVTPDVFPSPARLAQFVLLCAEARVPFKATAGLHHPLRSIHPLTYAPLSPAGMMHGFLNVLVACAAAHAGSGAETVGRILQEEGAGAFRFDDAGIGWRELRIGVDRLSEMRERLFASFGSCSLREPVSGMKDLGLL